MRADYIALDLETTGLRPKQDHILEIGAVKMKDQQILDTYSVFVKNSIPIPVFITELTGITDEMAAGGVSPKEAMEELLDFCGDIPLLGHNILFDYSFLKKEMVNQGMSFETQGIDTLKIAKKFMEKPEKKNLEALCRHYRIDREHCHRAYDDALAAGRLYHCMKEEFYEVSPTAFLPKPLYYAVKKEGPITKSQKVYLNDLIKYHRIELDVSVEALTKNEASRMIDGIILNYGRIKR